MEYEKIKQEFKGKKIIKSLVHWLCDQIDPSRAVNSFDASKHPVTVWR